MHPGPSGRSAAGPPPAACTPRPAARGRLRTTGRTGLGAPGAGLGAPSLRSGAGLRWKGRSLRAGCLNEEAASAPGPVGAGARAAGGREAPRRVTSAQERYLPGESCAAATRGLPGEAGPRAGPPAVASSARPAPAWRAPRTRSGASPRVSRSSRGAGGLAQPPAGPRPSRADDWRALFSGPRRPRGGRRALSRAPAWAGVSASPSLGGARGGAGSRVRGGAASGAAGGWRGRARPRCRSRPPTPPALGCGRAALAVSALVGFRGLCGVQAPSRESGPQGQTLSHVHPPDENGFAAACEQRADRGAAAALPSRSACCFQRGDLAVV